MEDRDFERLIVEPDSVEYDDRFRVFNAELIDEYLRTDGQLEGQLSGVPLLILTTVGAVSGRSHTTPLGYVERNGALIVVASKSGASRHPAWYHNIVTHPNVSVVVGTKRFDATGLVLDGTEREEAFQIALATFPQFADYKARTNRVLPVIELRLNDHTP